MDAYKAECFNLIQEFKNNNIDMDWSVIFEHPEMHENLDDALNDTMYQVALLVGMNEQTKCDLIGTIAYAQTLLAHSRLMNDEKEFIAAGKKLESGLKKLLTTGAWLKEAETNFDLLEKISEENMEEARNNPALIPVFVLLTVIAAISCEQADACNDESCDDESGDEE